MMISPEGFAEDNKGKSYEELIAVRNELMDEIKAFEEGTISQEEYAICPSPDTRYWCNLKYMIEICKLIDEAYNAEDDEDEEDDTDEEEKETNEDDGFDYAREFKRQTGEDLDADRTVKLIFKEES